MSKNLAEELKKILKMSTGDQYFISESDDDEPLCEDTGIPCWHLQEAAQFVAEDMAEVTGIDSDVLSAALTEAMKCDSACGDQYKTPKGDFKGGKGEAFATCEKYVQACCTGVADPAAFCAYLGRRAGKI